VVGLEVHANQPAGSLSHGQKQWLEIAMLVAQDPELLLVDEPVAGLTDEETARTGELLRQLAGDHTVLVIEHDMEFIRDLQAPVTVLHEGHVLCEGSMDQVQNDPRVIEVYLGRDTQEDEA
jgi:urea transport system ATP-binding protein